MSNNFVETKIDPLNRKIKNLSVYLGEISLPQDFSWNKDTITQFIDAFINAAKVVRQTEGILCPIINLTGIGIPTNVSLSNIIEVQKELGPQIVVTSSPVIGALANIFNNSTLKFVDTIEEARLMQSKFIDEYIAKGKAN